MIQEGEDGDPGGRRLSLLPREREIIQEEGDYYHCYPGRERKMIQEEEEDDPRGRRLLLLLSREREREKGNVSNCEPFCENLTEGALLTTLTPNGFLFSLPEQLVSFRVVLCPPYMYTNWQQGWMKPQTVRIEPRQVRPR